MTQDQIAEMVDNSRTACRIIRTACSDKFVSVDFAINVGVNMVTEMNRKNQVMVGIEVNGQMVVRTRNIFRAIQMVEIFS